MNQMKKVIAVKNKKSETFFSVSSLYYQGALVRVQSLLVQPPRGVHQVTPMLTVPFLSETNYQQLKNKYEVSGYEVIEYRGYRVIRLWII